MGEGGAKADQPISNDWRFFLSVMTLAAFARRIFGPMARQWQDGTRKGSFAFLPRA
jgi:hypothetical protein